VLVRFEFSFRLGFKNLAWWILKVWDLVENSTQGKWNFLGCRLSFNLTKLKGVKSKLGPNPTSLNMITKQT